MATGIEAPDRYFYPRGPELAREPGSPLG